jgi:hypothetical protein
MPSPPRALSFVLAPTEAYVEDADVPVEDATVVPLDVTSGGTESGSEGVSRAPLVASGQWSVLRSVHVSVVHNLGVAMATRSIITHRTSVASPPPPPSAGEMVNVLGHLDALQSTMALLVGRVDIVEVAT